MTECNNHCNGTTTPPPPSVGDDKQQKANVVVWADGCFDMMHFGHANALRQAKQLGDVLVVGVHTDTAIEKHKGPPVMTQDERYAAVRACKWVDKVVEDAPYVTQLEILEQHGVSFCVHGEDITTDENGNDCYQSIKDAGKYREIKRTEGVSTTDLVGRMLLLTRDHFVSDTPPSAFIQNTLGHFRASTKPPKPGDRVIYVDGAFDLFHVGHAEILQAAHQQGDYVLVGIHKDQEINQHKGSNFPIMNKYERLLSVLSCKWVDDVIVDAPFIVTEEFIKEHNVSLVVHGTVSDQPNILNVDPYADPKRLGIYLEIESTRPYLTTSTVVQRIIENRRLYEERNRKKALKEAHQHQLVETRHHLA